ncbi:BAG family molecular chaperone regulator 2-like [Uloborus diversus]|uniref:BAG family molecular chaperone regulator 2-like n=1 Tax=Uloborus diversus TaxID=327109 RepID=UPI00240976EB|nr:BAG family molecular chaperone regulator 2-like [Uloborus diversus]
MSNHNTLDNKDKLFHRSESVPHVTQRLIEMLDHIEVRVEMLREQASAMELEKNTLLSMLSTIRSNKDFSLISEGEREEIEITAERLLNRTRTVEVSVTTPRNELQQKALENVNSFFEDLNANIETDVETAKTKLQHYLNSCLSECKGPIDPKFQAVILECTADDQKRICKRLKSIMSSL